MTDINALLAALAEQLPQDDPDKCAQTLARMSQPEPSAEKYPAQITVFCDHCGFKVTRDYVVSDEMDKPARLAAARTHLTTNEGWQHDADTGDDFCPTHAAGDAN